MLDKFKKKLDDMKNINLLKKSNFFDEKYYVETYKDIKKSDIDPLRHYYYTGWKEGRNPSLKFDNNKYLDLNYDYDININPVVHYLKYGKNNPNIIFPKSRNGLKVSDKINDNLYENFSFSTILFDEKVNRLNVFLNTNVKFNLSNMITLLFASEFCNKYNYTMRIISDRPEENFSKFVKFYKISFDKIEFFGVNEENYLRITENDIFLCNSLKSLNALLHDLTITNEIFYLMQDIDDYFYEQGDSFIKYNELLNDSRVRFIVNSKSLYDYMSSNVSSNIKTNGIYFEPIFTPNNQSNKKDGKHNLLFFSNDKKSIFYFGLDCLNEAFLSGKLKSDEWTLYLDENIEDFDFDFDIEIKKINMNNIVRDSKDIDLFYNLEYSPEISLETSYYLSNGAVCVTNNYNGQDKSKYLKNIVSGDFNKNSIVEALYNAGELIKDSKNKNTLKDKSMEEEITKVIEYMKKIGDR